MFSVLGPKHYQTNSLGILSSNDPDLPRYFPVGSACGDNGICASPLCVHAYVYKPYFWQCPVNMDGLLATN